MCRSKAEGGGRCFAHSFPRYEGARVARAKSEGQDAQVRQAAQDLYEVAATQLAESPKGQQHLRDRLAAIERLEPEQGDDLGVLRRLVAAMPPATSKTAAKAPAAKTQPTQPVAPPRTYADFEARMRAIGTTKRNPAPASTNPLGLSLRDGVKRPDPAPKPRPAGPQTALQSALQTGLPTQQPTGFIAPAHWEPARFGRVSVPHAQRLMVDRWGGDPVEVEARRDIQHSNGQGWSEFVGATGTYRVIDDGNDRQDPDRRHGVIISTNVATGQQVAMRAVQDRTTGIWTIQHDQRA